MNSATSRAVLVAGASSGMGRAIALRLAQDGNKVCLLARRKQHLDDVVGMIADAGGSAIRVVGDASSPEVAKLAVERTVSEFGRLDVLVNAVGNNIPQRSLDVLTVDDWHDLVSSNLDPAFMLTRAAVPEFRANGGGLLIHIASAAVMYPDRSGVGYQASKAGVAALAKATTEEVGGEGIRVTIVCPGMTDTDLLRRRPTAPTADDLARALQPKDVAAMCSAVVALPDRVHVPEIVMIPAN